MSKGRQPQFRDSKTPPAPEIPQAGHHAPQNGYSLNLKNGFKPQGPVSPSQATYKVAKPKKIGRFQLWMQRNPLKFHTIAVGLGLAIFFSRPIYDIFIRPPIEGPRPKRERGYVM